MVEVDPKGHVRLNGTEIGRIEPTEITEDNYFDIWDNQLKDMIKENDPLLWDEEEDGEEDVDEDFDATQMGDMGNFNVDEEPLEDKYEMPDWRLQ